MKFLMQLTWLEQTTGNEKGSRRKDEAFDEDGNLCFEWGKVPTREGKAGYEEAIQFLDKQSPMQKVEISFGMNAIARTVSRSGGFRDSLQHATEKDIGKHGKASGYVEHIEYGPWEKWTRLRFNVDCR